MILSFLKIVMIVSILGILSNVFGGIVGYFGGSFTKKNIKSLIGFTAGMMTAVVCFELLQEAFKISGVFLISFFVIIGVFIIALIDKVLGSKKHIATTSLVIIIAMGAHNITEGLAIGSAFDISLKLGLSLMTTILLHNIPEGMVIGVTRKMENKSFFSNIVGCSLIGIFLGFGSGIGYLAGALDEIYVSICLALSAGAMLYIVACDLIPEMNEDKKSLRVGMLYILGIILGTVISNI